MGAATCYHPVSLHVIRGAAEYCGWKFGRIKQKWAFPEQRQARYDAELEILGCDPKTTPITEMSMRLQDCFMDDIRVHWLHQLPSGKWACQLQVDITNGGAALPAWSDVQPGSPL